MNDHSRFVLSLLGWIPFLGFLGSSLALVADCFHNNKEGQHQDYVLMVASFLWLLLFFMWRAFV